MKAYQMGIWPRCRQSRVLTDVSLSLWPGEVVGLVGENGAGKSTLMKILVGALNRDAGTVRRPARFGYCPQEPILYTRLTCDEHVDLFGRAYGISAAQTEKARAAIYQDLGFERYARVQVGELSGGTRAKLNRGLALLPDPELLLLDEPNAGFDWDTYQRFWQLVEARKGRGRTVLIVSHFIADADRFDRIITLHDGRVVDS